MGVRGITCRDKGRVESWDCEFVAVNQTIIFFAQYMDVVIWDFLLRTLFQEFGFYTNDCLVIFYIYYLGHSAVSHGYVIVVYEVLFCFKGSSVELIDLAHIDIIKDISVARQLLQIGFATHNYWLNTVLFTFLAFEVYVMAGSLLHRTPCIL